MKYSISSLAYRVSCRVGLEKSPAPLLLDPNESGKDPCAHSPQVWPAGPVVGPRLPFSRRRLVRCGCRGLGVIRFCCRNLHPTIVAAMSRIGYETATAIVQCDIRYRVVIFVQPRIQPHPRGGLTVATTGTKVEIMLSSCMFTKFPRVNRRNRCPGGPAEDWPL